LKHENIVKYFGHCFMPPKQKIATVMEFIPGGSLANLLKEYREKKKD